MRRFTTIAASIAIALSLAAPALAQGNMMWRGDTWNAPTGGTQGGYQLPDGTWNCGDAGGKYFLRGASPMMPGYGMMDWQGGYYGVHWAGLITVALVWITLALVIASLLTWLTKQKK